MNRIEILQDTPFDKKGSVLEMDDFRSKYSYLYHKDNSDKYVVENIKNDNNASKWFNVIEIKLNNFRVGDWVWHEGEKEHFVL